MSATKVCQNDKRLGSVITANAVDRVRSMTHPTCSRVKSLFVQFAEKV